jgi:hypothetical protein
VTFEPFDSVRVTRLLTQTREVDGSGAEPPQPRAGEVGVIVEAVGDQLYLVERITDDGRTVWIAEFHASELTLMDHATPAELGDAVSERDDG